MDGNQEECGTKTCRILADVGMFLFVWFFFLGGDSWLNVNEVSQS